MNLLNILEAGYFIVYESDGSFFNKCIVNAQKDEGFSEADAQFTHVEPSLGGPYSIYASPKGIRPINIFKTHTGRRIKIVRCKTLSQTRQHKISIWCSTRCNIPYGFIGLAWFKIKKIFKGKNIFSAIGDFCSEMSSFGIWRECVYRRYDLGELSKSDIWEESNYIQYMPKIFNEMMPADFLNTQYFELLYEGILGEDI